MTKELFNSRELVQPLTADQRARAVQTIVRDACYGLKYVYNMKEVAGILHWSKDMIYDALHLYRIDGFRVLSLVRIPWWSLAEYLLDPVDDIDTLFYAMIDSLPHKESKNA